jgi:hypothetical protein
LPSLIGPEQSLIETRSCCFLPNLVNLRLFLFKTEISFSGIWATICHIFVYKKTAASKQMNGAQAFLF